MLLSLPYNHKAMSGKVDINFKFSNSCKRILYTLLFILLFIFLYDATWAQDPSDLMTRLAKSKRDTARVGLLLQLSVHYISQDGSQEKTLDSAAFYYRAAESLNNSLPVRYPAENFGSARSGYLWKSGNFEASEKLFTATANTYSNQKQYLSAAKVWDYFGSLIHLEAQEHIALTDRVFKNAYLAYMAIPDARLAAHALGRMANVDMIRGRYEKAAVEMAEVIKKYKAFRYDKIYHGYYMLAEIYYRKNEIQKELLCRIECLNSFESISGGRDYDLMAYNFKLAEAYFRLKEYEKSILYFQKSIDLAAKQQKRELYFHFTNNLIDAYVHLKKYKTGLSILEKAKKKYVRDGEDIQRVMLSSELRLYNSLGKKTLAEKIIPDFKKVYAEGLAHVISSKNYHAINTFIYTYEPLLKYYSLNGQWNNLAEELEKLDGLPKKNMNVLPRLILSTNRYKLDSAQGNLLSALQRFQQIKVLQDSLNNAENTAQINQLEAKYRSVKKDRTIQTLNAQSTAQKANIDRINNQRNATIAGIIFSALFGLTMYIAYIGKQRNNAKLKVKQDEINYQNLILSKLVREKDGLLEDKDALLGRQENLINEKEWLVKEIHHRVKNNLQIVMSLLYTQAAYLKNSDAIEAIKDSQNRIQAISIIHQKLYSKAEVGHIMLDDYVRDLISYLSHSCDLSFRKIKFDVNISQRKLDISQAVPIGLILNEAITNSIKYAFSECGGVISIEALLENEEYIALKICDNGKGLPPEFNNHTTSSLGMEMMKALSKQLGGSFKIASADGVTISIRFKVAEVPNQGNEDIKFERIN